MNLPKRIPSERLDNALQTLRDIRKELNAKLGPGTRFEWQQALERQLMSFSADAIETMELLDALTAALNNRYGRDALRDVEHEAKQLRDALEELDRTTANPSEEDEAWAEYLARKDG